MLLGMTAERLFGLAVGARQRWGLALTAVGLIMLVVTLPSPGADHAGFSAPALVAFQAVLFGAGAVFVLHPQLRGSVADRGVMLAAAAGMLFVVSNVGVKALTEIVGHEGVLTA